MVFLPPQRYGELGALPDHISISDFMLDEQWGRLPHASSKDPYTCGLTGKTYSSHEVVRRVDLLARSLSKELGWAPNRGSEWDKVMVTFCVNTVS